MKTGDPNGPGLPNWPKYTAEKGETMIFDDTWVAEERSRYGAAPVAQFG